MGNSKSKASEHQPDEDVPTGIFLAFRISYTWQASGPSHSDMVYTSCVAGHMDGTNVDDSYSLDPGISLCEYCLHTLSPIYHWPCIAPGNNTSYGSILLRVGVHHDASLSAPSNLTLVYATDVPQNSNGTARCAFHTKQFMLMGVHLCFCIQLTAFLLIPSL